jgi:adenylate cyclase
VKDIAEAAAMDPISMKGISHPVVPYLVSRTSVGTKSASAVLTEKDEGLSLSLDLSGMDTARAARIRGKLQAALAMLDGPKPMANQ